MKREKYYSEHDRHYHRELIWQNSLDLYMKRSSLTTDVIIKMHKKYINSLSLTGKNKYKSLDCLRQVLNTKESAEGLAHDIFLNTANKRLNNLKR